MTTPAHLAIPIAERVSRFSYAIRNIAVEAQKAEAAGLHVRYLNVGNPPAFGFQPPLHLIEAVVRALRDGENGYGPSPGVAPAREAVAAEYTSRGWPVSPDRVLITAGTSEGIEIALSALVDPEPVHQFVNALRTHISTNLPAGASFGSLATSTMISFIRDSSLLKCR